MSGLHIHKNGIPEVIESSDGRLTLSVPIQFKRRAGRKLITLPNGESGEPRPWGIAPTALQLALARGHRWLAMLESGQVSSLREIAAQEGVDNSYVSRMMNLTVLGPDIVEAILDDTLPLVVKNQCSGSGSQFSPSREANLRTRSRVISHPVGI